MTATAKKVLIAGIVTLIGVGYLAASGVSKGWVYYVPIDQFVGEAKYQSQRVKLCGKVAEEGLSVNGGKLSATFTIRGEQRSLPVIYHGVIPDMFKAGAEVVVEGKLDAQNVFQAETLLTKCASKYETKDGMPQNHPNVAPAQASRVVQ